jgi:hypothetical protein
MGSRMNNYNIARDKSQVGQQVSEVAGNLYVGTRETGQDADLATQLAELRRAVADARIEGRIDDDSAEALGKEIADAAQCLPIENSKSYRGFELSMKRAKGLAEGLADVTVKVVAAIAAARGIL